MERVKFILFGYRKLKIDAKNVAAASSILLRGGIESLTSPDGLILVSEGDFTRACELLSGKMKYTSSEMLGALGHFKRIKCKRGLVVGAIISIIMVIFLGNIVWDIRIDGNSGISETQIRETLSECGFGIGSNWFFVDRGHIETEFLRKSKELAWININRNGTVAYIEVIEDEGHGNENQEEIPVGYANIVAGESCVIEEITVKRGIAMVKAGDAVKRGDILISGVLTQGGFCYAEGEVIARLSDTVTVEVAREYQKIVEISELPIETTLKIFNFPINIFKKYGNSYSDCDIIENVKVFSIFDSAPLPLCLIQKYARAYKTETAEYSDDELVFAASAKLSALTLAELEGKDLLRIKSYGEYTDTGYLMRSDIVYLSEIGKTLEFNVGR